MDKHTLKANALAAMRAVIACDWSKVILNVQLQRCEGAGRDMYKDSLTLLDIEVDAQLKTCYQNLKELFENGN